MAMIGSRLAIQAKRQRASLMMRLNGALSLFFRSALLLLIGAYRTIGTSHFGGQCRFEPSCSSYAAEAFRVHAPARAIRLVASRVVRCRPGGAFGYDPVPQARNSFS